MYYEIVRRYQSHCHRGTLIHLYQCCITAILSNSIGNLPKSQNDDV